MQKKFLYTPSTAHKRYSHQNTDYKNSYEASPFQNQNRRNQGKISSKIQRLKQSIDQIIGDFRQKTNVQKSAIQKVHSVNSDLSDFLNSSYKNPMTQSYRTSNFRQNNEQNEIKSEFIYPNEKDKIYQENLRLQQKLNKEIKSNNKLIKSVHDLSNQKRQFQNKSGPHTGRFSSNVQEQQQLISQNKRLKLELNQLDYNSLNKNNVSMQQFMEEFRRLKEQNQKLRQQTVQVFKY